MTNISRDERPVSWVSYVGCLKRADVEGTVTYGSGLATEPGEHSIEVFEVNCPDNCERRCEGKLDPADCFVYRNYFHVDVVVKLQGSGGEYGEL